MTVEIKKEITKLRLEGLGYKGIATQLGLTRDSIKSFCKRNGFNGNSSVVALNIDEKIERNLLCAECRKQIKQKASGRTRRFCSEECRRKWWKENQDKQSKSISSTYKFICPKCGEEFTSYGNKNRKYCCHDCFIKDRFWRDE